MPLPLPFLTPFFISFHVTLPSLSLPLPYSSKLLLYLFILTCSLIFLISFHLLSSVRLPSLFLSLAFPSSTCISSPFTFRCYIFADLRLNVCIYLVFFCFPRLSSSFCLSLSLSVSLTFLIFTYPPTLFVHLSLFVYLPGYLSRFDLFYHLFILVFHSLSFSLLCFPIICLCFPPPFVHPSLFICYYLIFFHFLCSTFLSSLVLLLYVIFFSLSKPCPYIFLPLNFIYSSIFPLPLLYLVFYLFLAFHSWLSLVLSTYVVFFVQLSSFPSLTLSLSLASPHFYPPV